MAEDFWVGDPAIRVQFRQNARARRLSLRVARNGGGVTLTAPMGVSLAAAKGFAIDKQDWLRRTLDGQPEQIVVAPGVQIPVEGRVLPVTVGPGKRGARVLDDRIEVAVARPGPRIVAALKLLARDRLAAASGRYAAQLGRSHGRITLRDTRSRWGSCGPTGDLMYSWRLIMAPTEVLEYVAAHEVAHLVEMNHSAAFWSVTAGLCPDYKRHRRWLRDHGAELQRYLFTD
jgi:predicted metal-dependent hydrolase